MAHWRWVEPKDRINGIAWVEVNAPLKDPDAGLNGKVWCPENGYYDPVLNVRFESKNHKRQYMREKGIKMQGGMDKRTVNYQKVIY